MFVSQVDGTVQRVKDMGQKSLDTPYGKFVLEKVDEALALSEVYVEKYLPEIEIEGEPGEEEIQKQGTLFTVKFLNFWTLENFAAI